MAELLETDSWSLEVPDAWTFDEDDETVVFTPPDDRDSALIVSVFYKETEITKPELEEFTRYESTADASLVETRLGEFSGYYSVYTKRDEEGEFAWRVWCVCCRDVLLYITYNCIPSRVGKDDAVVDATLKTLKFIPGE